MKFNVLSATPKQRENMAYLIAYMEECLRKKDKSYDHGNIAACTVGFAIKSRLFSPLNRYTIVDDLDGPMVVRTKGRHTRSVVVQENLLAGLFGEDYLSNIVFVGRTWDNPFNPFKRTAFQSLKYVIAYLKKAYQIEPAPSLETLPQFADNLRRDVEKRVAQLEELVSACNVIIGASALGCIKDTKRDSETELRILKNLLNQ